MPKELIRTIYLIVVEIVQIALFILAIYFICQVATGKIKININVERITKEK